MNKLVLVSGASKGLGMATAEKLVHLGYTVLAGAPDEEELKAIQQVASNRLIPVRLDITSADSIRSVTEDIQQRIDNGNRFHALVNNAGVSYTVPLEYLTGNEINLTLDVNLRGTIFMTRACIPLLKQSRGRIVIISSATALMVSPTTNVYAATKRALEGIADSIRIELGPYGINVSVVEPGVINTPLVQTQKATRDAMIDRFSDADRAIQEPCLRALDKISDPEKGSKPGKIAAVICKAVTADRPRPYYRAGPDATAARVLGALPVWLRDILLRKMYSLPKN